MSVSPSYRAFILEQLGRAIARIRARPMFGGVGIYAGDVFFALIASDTLYLKVDDSSRPDFEARGMEPFRPHDDHGEVMQYYQVPEEVVEEPDVLRQWAEKAIAVALAKKKGQKSRAR